MMDCSTNVSAGITSVLALFDTKRVFRPNFSFIFHFLEMPLYMSENTNFQHVGSINLWGPLRPNSLNTPVSGPDTDTVLQQNPM